ncbi:hypothetical protein Pcinc_031892 [Petrolisthes cinctipes]|uniref:Uncharacterized protein n=1 Tax=Petrolisthes cinctipes TaxID=88211 RepID=A0AAE1EVG2_PETCI|nr:hypothetical protein Pcinc_031892 [Petrolisthes cinctipes]
MEENSRYQRHIQDLRDELSTLHTTVAELERRYSDLSARYRSTVSSLDEVRSVREELDNARVDAEEEHRKRVSSEMTLTRDLVDKERKFELLP